MSRGIDYGKGTTNIDTKTGIRYGIMPMNAIMQAWCDSADDPEYPQTCPNCGNETIVDYDDGEHAGYTSLSSYRDSMREYACTHCELYMANEDTYPDCDDGAGYTYTAEGYSVESDSHGDLWVFKSPYFTRAQFCSPCAPGACYLENPCEDGERAYCFGPDWFDNDYPCPYPAYRVDTGELIYSPKAD